MLYFIVEHFIVNKASATKRLGKKHLLFYRWVEPVFIGFKDLLAHFTGLTPDLRCTALQHQAVHHLCSARYNSIKYLSAVLGDKYQVIIEQKDRMIICV